MANRLITSTSPYLLQHAHNPVDWFPWGKAALDKARTENKPIILSIGYSACHWCHVMEHQSFEDESIAALMNEGFVCIKVDREERPDVDNLYMDALHLMGIPGGWPLNVFLTPEQLPFYGGTYFSPSQWTHVLNQIAIAHKEKPEELKEIGERNRSGLAISEHERFNKSETLTGSGEILRDGLRQLERNFDAEWGGFGAAPKFPMPCVYRYLLHRSAVLQEPECRKMTNYSLEKMALGGIHDVLAGGFARYSVDPEWKIPHFEKMLYDNAQLCSLFSIAWLESKTAVFRTAAEGIIQFIRTELSHPQGAFFSALDADSEGTEGTFYVWTRDEIAQILGEDFALFSRFYALPEEGNFEHGKSVLNSDLSEEEFLIGLPEQEAEKIRINLKKCRLKLLEKRNSRIRPGLDDKIICSWNALMVSGLCDAYRVFQESVYLEMAINCANFIREKMLHPEQKLFRIWKNGHAHTSAFLDDYAHLILACIDLSEVSFEEKWLLMAEDLIGYVNQHFSDNADGLYFYTADHSDELLARKKEVSDNVIPSSNAQMAIALHRLGRLLHRDDFILRAEKMVLGVRAMMKGDLRYVSQWMQVQLLLDNPPADVAITGPNAAYFRSITETIFIPGKTVFGSPVPSGIPYLKDRFSYPEKTLAFVCSGKHCLQPTETEEELIKILRTFRKDS